MHRGAYLIELKTKLWTNLLVQGRREGQQFHTNGNSSIRQNWLEIGMDPVIRAVVFLSDRYYGKKMEKAISHQTNSAKNKPRETLHKCSVQTLSSFSSDMNTTMVSNNIHSQTNPMTLIRVNLRGYAGQEGQKKTWPVTT